MADVEKKTRGRPASKGAVKSKVEESKKRRSSGGGDANGEVVPAKRGRGRPPKSSKKKLAPKAKSGRGRGRPPKNAKKDKEESEEDDAEQSKGEEEEEEDQEELEESS